MRCCGLPRFVCSSPLALPPSICLAQPAASSSPGTGIEYGLVLDGAYASSRPALGSREHGLALGHNEASVRGNIGDSLAGRLTAVVVDEDGSIETELEEAFVETRSLPAGLTVRAGRFLSQIGYLNEQHAHTDDFVERPLPYRAFLGNHWFDDGVRLNWVAPAPLYWRVGIEAFDGGQLTPQAERSTIVGAFALSTRVGGDLGVEQSWQVGLAWLRNRLDRPRESAQEQGDQDDAGHAADHGHDEAHDHGHGHGARYGGRNLWIVDAVWKWAPDGNNRERQLRLSAEYARITEASRGASGDDSHEGWYLSAVYRFAPRWEAGARHGRLRVSEPPHADHFDRRRLQETDLMLVWKHSHASTLRLQWTTQRDRGGFAEANDALMLQYTMSLGAHGAHAF